MARRNARVILAVRSVQKGEEALLDIIKSTGNSNVIVRECDLASLRSVRNFAYDVLNSEERLDVLICNAGTGTPFGRQLIAIKLIATIHLIILAGHLTEDGLEMQFQTNHLGNIEVTSMLHNNH